MHVLPTAGIMEVKSKIFIVAVCWVVMVKMAIAHLNLPLCKRQSDLLGQFSRILGRNGKNSVVKRERGVVHVHLCERISLSTYRAECAADGTQPVDIKMSGWPLSCLHASIIKDEKDEAYFSYNIYICCNKCEFPDYSMCALAGLPDWQCGSEAYDCVFSCRDEDSVLEAVYKAADLGLHRKRELHGMSANEVTKLKTTLRQLRKENQCYQKKCTGGKKRQKCCLIKTCVPLKKLTKELRKKKRVRGN